MLPSEPYHRTRRRVDQNNKRVTVAVSPEMAKLRDLQTGLNYFLYSTELSYGLVLTGSDSRLMNKKMPVSDALADVYSSAWYPSNQGRKKYTPEISSFLDQLGRNPRYVSRAVIVQWYSHFEEYLKTRVGPRTKVN